MNSGRTLGAMYAWHAAGFTTFTVTTSGCGKKAAQLDVAPVKVPSSSR
jgi:hypothetical protein